MPTILAHTAVPLALGLGLGTRGVSPRLLVAGVAASMAPDLDAIGLHLGIAYSDTAGHRGLTHSLAFAVLLALLAAAAAGPLRTTRRRAFAFVLASAASHGLLDMMTTGGLGVAWWWPLSDARHFLPWRPIRVSPLTLQRLFGPVGRAVMVSELWFVWLPAALACGTCWLARMMLQRRKARRRTT
jgi:inner membrane protein